MGRDRPFRVLLNSMVLDLLAAPVLAQTPDGAAVYQKACASCHAQPAADSGAPTREALGQFAPEAVLTSLTTGKMFRQGSELTDAERRAVAAFVAGRPVGQAAPASGVGRCTTGPPPLSDAMIGAGWTGGAQAEATRGFSRPPAEA